MSLFKPIRQPGLDCRGPHCTPKDARHGHWARAESDTGQRLVQLVHNERIPPQVLNATSGAMALCQDLRILSQPPFQSRVAQVEQHSGLGSHHATSRPADWLKLIIRASPT